MVRYILSSVGSVLKLDRRCPHCSCPNGRIHSSVHLRRIVDLKTSAIAQRCMKCPRCGMTWMLRAGGVGAGRQRSDRLRGIGAILYMLGLSVSIRRAIPSLPGLLRLQKQHRSGRNRDRAESQPVASVCPPTGGAGLGGRWYGRRHGRPEAKDQKL